MMKQPKGFINFFRLLFFCYKNLTKNIFYDSINVFKQHKLRNVEERRVYNVD